MRASLLLAGFAIAIVLVLTGCPAAHAHGTSGACVSNYHALSADHGYRRYRVIDGRHCWYNAGHDHGARAQAHFRFRLNRSTPKMKSPEPPPVMGDPPSQPTRMLLVLETPMDRIEQAFFALAAQNSMLPGWWGR